MALKLAELTLQKSTRWHWEMRQIKKPRPLQEKQFFMINNFTFIPTQDFLTRKVCKMNFVFFCIGPQKKTKGPLELGGYNSKVFYHKKLVFRSGFSHLI